MTKIHADRALTADGWQNDVLVQIGVDGRIAHVGQGPHAPEAHRVATLLPAPVNAHSHAFQRAMAGLTEQRGPDPRDSFWTWRRLMYRFLDRLTPEHVEAITAFVQMEMLEAGFATNVEFHYVHHQPGGVPYDTLSELSQRVAQAAAETGIGLTLLPVQYQYGGLDQRPLTGGQMRFGTDLDQFARLHEGAARAVAGLPDDCRMGVAPHSLRAVDAAALPQLLALTDGPFHMHLAEQKAEVEEVHQVLGQRPVEWVLDTLEPDARMTFIHCTQMQPHETRGLARFGAVAGLCPITESNLGDGIFDGVNWLDHGGRISIGSDSNIRISLSEELRVLEHSQRLRDHSRAALATPDHSTGRRLLEAVLSGGALSAGRKTGQIAVGYEADLMALDGAHPDLDGLCGDTLLDTYIFAGDDRMVRDVWSAGRHMVREGRHIKKETNTRAYKAALRDLRADL
ncbi:MAG: formimidoylglutamate deiminase [Pseudomonadota bacterium]